MLVQTRVSQELERLITHLRISHVGDTPYPAAEDRWNALLEVVDVRHQRIDHDDELGAALDGDVDIRGRTDAAVDELPALDLDRPVNHRQRRRRGDRFRDWHVLPAGRPEDDPLAGVEVSRREVELGLDQAKIVGEVRVGKDLADVLLDSRSRVDACWQRFCQAGEDVHDGHLPPAPGEASSQAREPQRHEQGPGGEVHVVRTEQRAEVCLAKRRWNLLVHDARHLLGREAVGEQGRDEGARARSDIDVEVVDGPVHRQQVERPECSDLIDASGEATAAENQCCLGPAAGVGFGTRRLA